MIDTDFYTKQFNRRRAWDVIDVSPHQKIQPMVRRTLQKALAISALELPVGDMITSVVETHQEIPQEVLTLLVANAQDEEKHDEALNRLKNALQPMDRDIRTMDYVVAEAQKLCEVYSPVTVAGVLEASIFFVVLPMYRFLGGGGFRTVANDISNDENIHVATNINLANDLGWDKGGKLNELRKDVIDWLVSDLPWTHEKKFLSGRHWSSASDNLYHSGKAPQLKETKRAVMPSFFEKDNRDLPRYS
jgi:hypothetical protein